MLANEQLTQVGLGVAVAILILREVFRFLKDRKNGNGNGHSLHASGAQPIEFWREQFHAAVRIEVAGALAPLFKDVDRMLKEQEYIRQTHLHAIGTHLQNIQAIAMAIQRALDELREDHSRRK